MILKISSIFVVFGSFIGGFLLSGGNLLSLWHPSELIVIIGIALGVFIGSSSKETLKKTIKYIGIYFSNGRTTKKIYEDLSSLFEELSKISRSSGILALENHVLDPYNSSIFQKYPAILKYKELTLFISKNIQFILLSPPKSVEFEHFLMKQIQKIYQQNLEVPKATGKISSLMPGFGIVAAVIGVILTMGLLGGEIDISKIGESVGAALSGTLIGIFIAFGIIATFTSGVEAIIREEKNLFETTATYILGIYEGYSTALLIEIAERIKPIHYQDI